VSEVERRLWDRNDGKSEEDYKKYLGKYTRKLCGPLPSLSLDGTTRAPVVGRFGARARWIIAGIGKLTALPRINPACLRQAMQVFPVTGSMSQTPKERHRSPGVTRRRVFYANSLPSLPCKYSLDITADRIFNRAHIYHWERSMRVLDRRVSWRILRRSV